MKPTRVEVECLNKDCVWIGHECATLNRAVKIAEVHFEHTQHRIKISVLYFIDEDNTNE